MRLATRLDEMRTARNWRGIVAQEGAALALARDVRVAYPGVASFILSALGHAHRSMGNFSQAIAYHTQHLAIAREVGDRAREGKAYGNLGCAHDSGGEGKRGKTLSLQELGSGQIQGTSWRNFAPFTTSTFIDIHASARAKGTAGDRQ